MHPNTIEVNDEPAISVEDVTRLFRDKQFPDHWREWKKTRRDWVVNTTALLHAATVRYVFLKTSVGSPALISENCSFRTSVQACVRDSSNQLVPVSTGDIANACQAVVTRKLGASSAESWNCRAACFALTLTAQRQNCPSAN